MPASRSLKLRPLFLGRQAVPARSTDFIHVGAGSNVNSQAGLGRIRLPFDQSQPPDIRPSLLILHQKPTRGADLKLVEQQNRIVRSHQH